MRVGSETARRSARGECEVGVNPRKPRIKLGMWCHLRGHDYRGSYKSVRFVCARCGSVFVTGIGNR